MLIFLNQCSRERGVWFLMALIALGLEIIALYFQHIARLAPCVICIYERCALFGIMAAGLLGAIAPKTSLRYMAFTILLYSAWKGIVLSWEHIMIQVHRSLFTTCDFTASFPSWLPLDKWLPQVFLASNSCSIHPWKFLTLEVSKWLLGIFMAYFVCALLFLIAQPFKPKRNEVFTI